MEWAWQIKPTPRVGVWRLRWGLDVEERRGGAPDEAAEQGPVFSRLHTFPGGGTSTHLSQRVNGWCPGARGMAPEEEGAACIRRD